MLAILISDKIGFEARNSTWDKESHFIMVRGSTYQEDITIISVCTARTRASQFMKQKAKELKNRLFKNNRNFNTHPQ